MKVFISAFACGSNWGSEVGMGYHWINALARHVDVSLVTCSYFQADLEQAGFNRINGGRVRIHYVEIDPRAMAMFWAQGHWSFYYYYNRWMLRALECARTSTESERVDLVHQLNLTGYREPGYLWKLKQPYIWGPVNGHAQMPWRYVPSLGINGGVKCAARNIVNEVQMRVSRRVRSAMSRADLVLAGTTNDSDVMLRVYGRRCPVLNETGSPNLQLESKCGEPDSKPDDGVLRVVWCGQVLPRKCLSLAIQALARCRSRFKVHLSVIGEGPDKGRCMDLAHQLGVLDAVRFMGLVNRQEVLSVFRSSDVLLFTGLQEGTPHVVLEALSCGIPVVCHNVCGQGDVVEATCGIKIAVADPERSVSAFADALSLLAADSGLLATLKSGAIERSMRLAWESKSVQMLSHYEDAIAIHSRRATGQ